jgi:signal transduction histidine kinase
VLFSKDGRIVYSTDSADAGGGNNKPYFYTVIAKGNSYSRVVSSEPSSFEKDTASIDIVETYVPIMTNNEFIGAIGMKTNITAKKRAFNNLVLKAGFIPLGMMLCGFIFTVFILIRLDGSITRQKKVEQELKEYAEKLSNSNRDLESFAHIASHDLQEPLRKVIAFGDRLSDKYVSALDDQGRDYLQRMQNAARRMQNLISGLLHYSRVSTKAQPFKPVDLAVVTGDVLSDLQERIQQANVHVDVGDLATIEADPLQMHQLIQNLVSNALKYSKKDMLPVVKIYGKEIENGEGGEGEEEKMYQLTIEDNGIGFDQKYANRIFDIFQRLHGRKEYEGSGIGLSICRKIVDRHDGAIAVKSALGEGAVFVITLPAKQKRGGNNGNKGKINNYSHGR